MGKLKEDIIEEIRLMAINGGRILSDSQENLIGLVIDKTIINIKNELKDIIKKRTENRTIKSNYVANDIVDLIKEIESAEQ